MDVPPRDLSLDEFIVEMSGQPVESLTHERLMHLAGRLRLSHALVGASVAFSRDGYARNLVCRTSSFELLVLCWRPGQESTIHDHAGALNAIRVYSGELTSRTFTRTSGAAAGDGPVAQDGEERVPADSHMVGLDRNGIHQLANTSGAGPRHRPRLRARADGAQRLLHHVGRGGAATAALHPGRRPRLTTPGTARAATVQARFGQSMVSASSP